MAVCFIGHRKIDNKKELFESLRATIISLIDNGVTTFIFGSMSDFDTLSWEIVTELKSIYPFIKRIYVRSSFQYISTSYEKYLLNSYEQTYFPDKIQKAGKCSYVERNYEMIDTSIYCVFYYNPNYIPPSKRKSGTKIAYDYALRKKKTIINLYK